MEGQRGVLLGTEPPGGPDALLGYPCRTLEVSAARRLEGAGHVEEGRRPRVGAVLRDDPCGPGDPPATFGDLALDDLLGAEPERRLGRREPVAAFEQARVGALRGSRSTPAGAPAGGRSRRTGRSPRRRAALRSPLRRTRRRRAAMRARRTPSGPPGASRHQYRPRSPGERLRLLLLGPRGRGVARGSRCTGRGSRPARSRARPGSSPPPRPPRPSPSAGARSSSRPGAGSPRGRRRPGRRPASPPGRRRAPCARRRAGPGTPRGRRG